VFARDQNKAVNLGDDFNLLRKGLQIDRVREVEVGRDRNRSVARAIAIGG